MSCHNGNLSISSSSSSSSSSEEEEEEEEEGEEEEEEVSFAQFIFGGRGIGGGTSKVTWN